MSGVGTVVWVDVLIIQIIATFLFDYLLLWATAEVAKVQTTARRLGAASFIGSAYFVLHALSREGIVPYYDVLRLIPVVLLMSTAMLLIAFGPLPWRRLLVVAAYFYGIGFVSAGAGTVTSFLIGSPTSPDPVAGFVAAGGAILLMAELGWGVVQRRIWQQLYQMPVDVHFGGDSCRVMSLVDTGNRLRDPLTGHPVIVIEQAVLQRLLPANLQPAVEQMEAGDLTAVTRLLASERWSSRFRVIPFSSIGRKHGLMVGFRPDDVRLIVDGRAISVGECILAVCKGPLDPDGTYRALVHPELVQSALAGEQTPDTSASGELYVGRRPTGDIPSHY